MATKISTQLTPATVKTFRLKERIKELYLKFGYTEDQANYHMLCDAEEWEALEEPVTKMVRNAPLVVDKDKTETKENS